MNAIPENLNRRIEGYKNMGIPSILLLSKHLTAVPNSKYPSVRSLKQKQKYTTRLPKQNCIGKCFFPIIFVSGSYL